MSDKEPPKNPWDDDQDQNQGQSAPKTGSKKSSKPESSNDGGNVVDDMIDQLQEKLSQFVGGGKSNAKVHDFSKHTKSKANGGGGAGGNFFMKNGVPRFPLMALIFVGVFGFWLSSGFFRVQEGEAGVLMRFGRMTDIVGPGLRYHWPAPIEKVLIKKVSAVNRIDGGLSLTGRDGAPDSTDESDQALTLTADENMVIIGYSVQWRIKDIREFLFTAREPEALIVVAAESAIREVIGQTSARMALTEGREGISDRAHALLQKILDSYKLGIEISSFQLQRVEAPPQVIESFNDVQASLVDADRLKNEAEAYRNQIVPVARGEAEQITQDAMAYSKKHVAEAEGEASRFASVYKAYLNSKDVTLARYHMDTMTRVLGNSSTIVLDPKVGNMVPYLPVNELQKRGGAKLTVEGGANITRTGASKSSQPDLLTQGGRA